MSHTHAQDAMTAPFKRIVNIDHARHKMKHAKEPHKILYRRKSPNYFGFHEQSRDCIHGYAFQC